MNHSLVLLLVAGLLSVYGGFAVLKGVRSVRSRQQFPGALMYWEEPAAEGFGRDPAGSLAVLIHRGALILMGIIAIVSLLRRPASESALFVSANWPDLLADVALVGSVAMLGFTWGVSFFGPLAERLGGEHHYAVVPGGIVVGGNLLPWACFSHFTLEAERNLVHIWSASLPAEPGMVAVPSEPGAAARLAAILQEHLPDAAPSPLPAPGKWALPMRMGLLCVPFVAVAYWLSSSPLLIMMFLDALLMWALQILGAGLIGLLLYGGKTLPLSAVD